MMTSTAITATTKTNRLSLPRNAAHRNTWKTFGPTSLILAALVLLAVAAEARTKEKPVAPKRDALADYVKRMAGTVPGPAPGTPGSLWIDNG